MLLALTTFGVSKKNQQVSSTAKSNIEVETATSTDPVCFLGGYFNVPPQTRFRGLDSIVSGGMIRRTFKAGTYFECKSAVQKYCVQARTAHDSKPGKLQGYFMEKPQGTKSQFFLEGSCVVQEGVE